MIYYTVNTNNYIPDLKAPDWVQVITNVDESTGDPVRDSRIPKIRCPFSGPSVYIDASKVHLINEKFQELSAEILDKHDLFVLQHPHSHNYLEECAEYVYRGWVSEEDILSFTKYVKDRYNFSKHFQCMGTIIWRRDQQDFNQDWWHLYMHGGVRDQLSMAVALPSEYGSSPCRDFINQFSDAEPGGIWWQSKQGSYQYSDKKDPDEFITTLSQVTGLNKRFRYRAAVFTRTGEIVFGDRSKYWPKNDPVLKINNSQDQKWQELYQLKRLYGID